MPQGAVPAGQGDQGASRPESAGVSQGKPFISYASQDATIANAIVAALERAGIPCWIAPRDVIPGAFYADAIVRAIDTAQALVLVLSQHAAVSHHILREVERAGSKRLPIISLKVDLSPLPAALEYFLNTSQWLDASASGIAPALPRLVEALRHLVAGGAHSSDFVKESTRPSTSGSAYAAPLRPRRNSALIAFAAGITIVAAYLAWDRFWPPNHMTATPTVAAMTAPASSSTTLVTPEKSVAVLPFVDMSEKQDQGFFSDGLSEELIDMLSKIPDLRVPARTSSFYFKGKQTTIADIAKALSVTHVLEGSVRKAGNHLRITTQLVRADNDNHLWSETYDRNLNDIFQVQDDIAGAVVKARKVSLLNGDAAMAAPTTSAEAYSLYLQARSIWRFADDTADFERAADYLRRAVATDPRFADAWAVLSRVLLAQATPSYKPPDQKLIDEARRLAKKALALNSTRSEPHLAYAYILMYADFDIRGAEAEIQQALKLDPNSPGVLVWADTLPMFRGQLDKALEYAQKSVTIDPVNPIAYGDLARIYYFAKRYPEALAANRKMLDLDPRAYIESLGPFIWLAQGNPTAALNEIESHKEFRENCACLVLAYDALGRNPDADIALAHLEEHHANDNAYQIGLVYATRGQLNQAFEWFDRAYRQRDAQLFSIKLSPRTKNLRSDPRFDALVRKLGLD